MSARGALPVLLLALGLAGCGGSEGAGVREAMPDLELRDLSGKAVRLGSFKGKVLLLDFWATYCEPCRESIPELEKVYERRKAQGVEFVGVNLDASDEGVREYVAELKMAYPVLRDPENLSRTPFRLRGLPTAVLIDRAGSLRRSWTGYESGVTKEIEAEIEKLLEEKP